ncbi:putative bifunctional diguanylate cyclase/phosphodiesterase [Kineosporia succinea]|uniref:Diguanylate cyclase (GGDEF)-like protein n=1 Tax=Kineosporia succinea TaxID=84632 RepID=A0ABT9P8Y0_9ACTN|nr:EAL domain-containing protein [Kineosporia succinea]MDP9828869.1 diguanylate cyclase (GGDEF)-like protein [Kineosporia succinea]
MRLDAGRRFLLVAALALGAYWLVPAGIPRSVLQAAIIAGSAVAALVAARLDRERRHVWLALALAMLAGAVADSIQAGYLARGEALPSPSWCDLFWTVKYVMAGAALVMLQHRRRFDVAGVLDTAVITAAGGLVLWVTGSSPLTGGLTGAEQLALIFPLASFALLALAMSLITCSPLPVNGLGVAALVVGVVAGLVGNVLYGASGILVTPQQRWYESLYLVGVVAWGYGSLRSATAPAPAANREARAFSPVRLLLTSGALMAVPAMLVYDKFHDSELNHVPLAIFPSFLFLLVPLRMSLATRELNASTRQRDAYRDDLVHQAAHDPLTDLPNRAYLMELLAAQLQRARRNGTTTAVLFVDLDFFKRVNDQLGHAAGDEVLRTVTERMKGVLRAGDVIGRQGGDEFVVLVDPVPPPAELMAVADRLVRAVSEPIMTAGGKASVGASIGIALCRDGRTDPEKLLQDADLAAYRAKSNGRGRAEVFDMALRTELEARAKLEADIRAGLADGQFELHYQPVMSVATGSLRSYEALIRWNHPERGLVPPAGFIPPAEESLLICEIGRWVLGTATRQLAGWIWDDPETHRGVTVSVNISARHLASPSLVDEVRQALHESGLEAARLVLEITETALMDEPTADAHLRDLRALGVTVSLDDFGTGYTSIGQLQKLQVDTLKIDQSFLHADDTPTQALVELMVTAAHAFSLDVVAEGVETREQLDRLADIGCELAQGYYLGRPKPARDTVVQAESLS